MRKAENKERMLGPYKRPRKQRALAPPKGTLRAVPSAGKGPEAAGGEHVFRLRGDDGRDG